MATDLLHVGDTENEANRIENVRLPRPVQARDGVEGLIEAWASASAYLSVWQPAYRRWSSARGTT